MTRRTTNPMTRREAQKILAEPIRDGRESRLAASYLDLLDAVRDQPDTDTLKTLRPIEMYPDAFALQEMMGAVGGYEEHDG